MNTRQLTALWVGLAAEAAAFLFPPFRDSGTDAIDGAAFNRSAGYHFLAAPSAPGHPDLPLLALEMALIGAVAWAAVASLGRGEAFDPAAHRSRPPRPLFLLCLLSLTCLLNSPARAQCGYAGADPCHTFDAPAVPALNGVLGYDFVEYDGYLHPGGTDVFAFAVTSPGGLYLDSVFGSSTRGTAPGMALYDGDRDPITPPDGGITEFAPYEAPAGLYYVRLTPQAGAPITYVRARVFPQAAPQGGPPATLGLPPAVPEPCPALLGLAGLPWLLTRGRRGGGAAPKARSPADTDR